MTQKQSDTEENRQSKCPIAGPKDETRNRLTAFLDEVHAQMPEVPLEECQKDIEEAIAAVRERPIE